MREQGIITKVISGQVVEVAIKKSPACGSCGVCREIGSDEMMGVEAVDEIGARIGAIVEIEIPAGTIITGSLITFILPIVFLAFGYLAGFKFAGEIVGVVSSFVLLFFSFFVVRWYDQKIQQRVARRAQIVRVVSR